MIDYSKYFREIDENEFNQNLVKPYHQELRDAFRKRSDAMNQGYFLSDSEVNKIWQKVKEFTELRFNFTYLEIQTLKPLTIYHRGASNDYPPIKRVVDTNYLVDWYEGFDSDMDFYDRLEFFSKGKSIKFHFRKDSEDWFWVMQKSFNSFAEGYWCCDQLEGFLKFLEVKLT